MLTTFLGRGRSENARHGAAASRSGKRLFAAWVGSGLQAATLCRYRKPDDARRGVMSLAVTLDDKYLLESGRVYLTGTQALVRLPMMQRQRDLAANLNTAGYISGYRGSPPGRFDQTLGPGQRS